MATLIRVPALGIAIANVSIVRWFLSEGERVAQGQALLEVQTEKVTMEIPAECSGVLRRLFFEPGAEMAVGTPIAIIGEAGQNVDDIAAEAYAELEKAGLVGKASLRPGSTAAAASVPAIPSGRVWATPVAKRMAKEKGVDLAQVRTSDPEGRITEKDVIRHLEQLQTAAPPAPQDEAEIIPLHGARKSLAEHMVASIRTSPHYTMAIEVDCGRLVALRSALKDEFKGRYDLNLTYLPFVVKAVALAVPEVPIVNATMRDESIVVFRTAHVGVAVAAEDLILVPVVRRPISKTIFEIGDEIARYTSAARSGRLTLQDVAGGTITITSMGMTDVIAGTAIINQPQVAMIALGRIADRVVPMNGEIAVRPIMCITFTYDHRVVMGVPGARFAERVKFYLEHPEVLQSSP